ncbi:unnamed protein product [Polarella glacialis]|uniref:Uncharacterized protein n=1 Tax=Polarella glacialis TaxID=89957 RepID=A0A813HL33_POLGL|nr:unnamed protein product [Polarella glacialis]CAE8717107.1 unnamed protein product [Polarella glacialis]
MGNSVAAQVETEEVEASKTLAPEDGGVLYLDLSGSPNQGQVTVELEVEADQAAKQDFHSWNTDSDWKRNHLRHESKLNAFLGSFAEDDSEERVKQMRRHAAKLLGTSLSAARPQIFMQAHLNSDDSFPSSEPALGAK